MAANELEIVNVALSHLGHGALLTSTDGSVAGIVEAGVEKDQAALHYPRCRNMLLESYAWRFARAFVELTLADDGADAIWGDEYENAYAYPADCLLIRRIVNDLGYSYYGTGVWPRMQTHPFLQQMTYHYVVRQHEDAKVILMNVDAADAKIEYTRLVTDVLEFTPMFETGLTHLVAAYLAPTLTVSPEMQQSNLQLYNAWTHMAEAASYNEENPYPQPRSSFVNARGAD